MVKVVVIAGVTCGGKTTLVNELAKQYPHNIIQVIHQDDYFLPKQDPRHVWMTDATGRFINWELISSFDTDRLMADIRVAKERCPPVANDQLIVVDGHTALNHPPLAAASDEKYFVRVSREECLSRRLKRTQYKPSKPGYFEAAVWPTYVKHMAEVIERYPDVKLLDGEMTTDELVAVVSSDLGLLAGSVRSA